MSGAPTPPQTPPQGQPPDDQPAGAAGPRRRLGWFRAHTPLHWLLETALVLLLAFAALLLAVRFAPLTGEMRQFIQSRVEGLEIGPYGKLHVEGLGGDLWRDFSLRRVTISDAKGVWLEADGVRVRWTYAALLGRRLQLRDLSVGRLHLIRQPVPKARAKPGGPGPALSYAVDRIKARIDLEPAFALRKGIYDLGGGLEVIDHGAAAAKLDAESRLRAGDFFKLDLALGGPGKDRTLRLIADAREVKGGAIAGVLGLDPAQPFDLTARLSGAVAHGQLTALVRSGALRPIDASGAWSPGGGGVSAHVLLGASRWTRGFVGPFGPEAELALIGKQRLGALYDLDLRLIASNVVIMARGPLDLGKRASGGMALSVAVNDLHKLTPAPAMKAGRATGMLSGSLDDLRFAGKLEAQDLGLWGWRLARAAGTAKVGWKKGELDVQGDLAGSGGSGAGVLAEAGGPSPKAVVDVMRLKDGRILVKSLDVVGKALKLQGSGGQNPLLRGLSFKGQAQVADLAQLAPGTKGQLDLSWSASQEAGPNRPWLFNAEGRGQHMTTGAGEIDRLMGPEPRLSLAAAFQDNAFLVSKATLEGAKERAGAEGRWGLAGDLDFKLNWDAEGPFGFGPLEVDGKAHGGGRLAGTLGAPKAELTAAFDSIAFPQMTIRQAQLDLTFMQAKDGSDGTIALTGQSIYGAARAWSAFRFLPAGLDLTAIDADVGGIEATGALSLRDGAPSGADLKVAIGPGVLISAGQAAGTVRIAAKSASAAGADTDIDLEAKGVVVRGQPLAFATARLTAKGPLAKLPYQVSADGAWLRTPVKLSGGGLVTQDPKGYSATFEGSGALRRAPFKTLEPIQVRLDDGDTSARGRLSLGGGQALVDGRQVGQTVSLNANLSQVDLSFLSEDFTGRFDANVALAGLGPSLHGSVDAELKDAHSRDSAKGLSIDGQIKARLDPGKVTVDARLGSSQQGLASDAHFVLPAQASAAPFRVALVTNQPVQGSFQANGQIQPLWDLFLGGERTLGGQLMAKADIGGTLADPKVTGRIDLSEGLFDDYPTGLKLRGVSLGAALNTNGMSLDRLEATDGAKGRVSGQGQMSFARDGGGNLTLRLTGFRLIDNDTAQADASGDVTITREADGKAKLAGALEITRGEANAAARTGPGIVTMEVVEKNKPFRIDEQLAPPPATGPQSTGAVALDVTLKAPRGVFIKGRGLNLEMALDAKVGGTTAKPVLDGEARVVRGDYDFAGKRFEFDNRGTVKLSNDPGSIRLDLTATREDPSLTAVIRIQGTAAKPQITLSSTPVLPTDEVLSQVLFGSSAAQLSPFEAAEVASALTALASGGGFDVIGSLRSFTRLDRIALVGTQQTGYSVAGGKYLTDNVYVELAGGGRYGASGQIEYRVTRNLSLVSKVNDQITTLTGTVIQGGDELSIRWRHDFKDKKTPTAGQGVSTAP